MPLKISVIIPVYNGEKYITRAIESVLNQTRPADEIIVVDDGSTDQTKQILESYADRIKFKVVPNGGPAFARNEAIAMSSGDWIALLDADDIWYPDKLEIQIKALEQYPEVGFCCSNFHFKQDDTGKNMDHFTSYCEGTRGLIFDEPIIEALPVLLRVNFVGVSTVLVRRSILNKVGFFDLAYRGLEDYDCWLKCAFETPFLVVKASLMNKYFTGQNLSGNWLVNCQLHNVVLEKLLSKHGDFLKKQGYLSLLKLKMAWADYEIGNRYVQRKDYILAWQSYFTGLGRHISLKNCLEFCRNFIKSILRMFLGCFINKGRA